MRGTAGRGRSSSLRVDQVPPARQGDHLWASAHHLRKIPCDDSSGSDTRRRWMVAGTGARAPSRDRRRDRGHGDTAPWTLDEIPILRARALGSTPTAVGAMAAALRSPAVSGNGRATRADDPTSGCTWTNEAGETLVREGGRLAPPSVISRYLASDPDVPFPGPAWFAERGPGCPRIQGAEGFHGAFSATAARYAAATRRGRPRQVPVRRR